MTIVHDKIMVWVHYNGSTSDFTSVVSIRTLPGKLKKLVLPVTQDWWRLLLLAFPLNWIHSKILRQLPSAQ